MQLGVGELAVEIAVVLVLLDGAAASADAHLILVRGDIVVAVVMRGRPVDGERHFVGLALVKLDVFARPFNRDFRLVTRIIVVYIVVAGRRHKGEQSQRHGLEAAE